MRRYSKFHNLNTHWSLPNDGQFPRNHFPSKPRTLTFVAGGLCNDVNVWAGGWSTEGYPTL